MEKSSVEVELDTTCVTTFDVLAVRGLLLELGKYTAVMEWDPALRDEVMNVACPLAMI